MRLAGGKDGKEAVLPFAGTGRLHALDVFEGHVQQAAFAAVHGRKGVGRSGADDLVGGYFCLQFQFLRAHGFEIGGVEADQVVLALLEAQHLRGNGFKCAQQLAVMLGDEGHVGTAELDVDHAPFESLWIARAIARGDAELEAETAQFVQRGKEPGDLLCSLLQVIDWHNSLVSQSRAGCGLQTVETERFCPNFAHKS